MFHCQRLRHSSILRLRINGQPRAKSRIASFARQARARAFGSVLEPARGAGRLRRNRPGRPAPAVGHDARAHRDGAASLRPLADGRIPETGASLAGRARPRELARPRQLRPLPVSVLAQPDAGPAVFQRRDFCSHAVGCPLFVQPERRHQAAWQDAAGRDAPARDATSSPRSTAGCSPRSCFSA